MKEKWSKGKHAGCVVSNAPNPHGDNGGTEYYGGYLVAESIPKQEYVNLIAAAPEMLSLLERALEHSNCPGDNCVIDWHAQARIIIAKAKGGL